MSDQLMSTKQASAEMHVAESTIRTWVCKGWLPIATKAHRRNYYWRRDLLEAERRARRGQSVADTS